MPGGSRVIQSCDACRHRKVRCTSGRPCRQCLSADLVCTTLIKPRKKGRQGKTANVLTQLRKNDTQSDGSTLQSPQYSDPDTFGADRSPPRTAGCEFVRSVGLVNYELVRSCSDYFFSHMLGTVPILHPDTLQRQIDQSSECLQAYCLVTAFCAFVVTQTGYCVVPQANNDCQNLTQEQCRERLIEEATAARKHLDPLTEPVKRNIIIAFLLYGCHIGLGNQRHAYYFLREATTLYTASAFDDQTSTQAEDEDPSLAENLFWLLLVSERAHAIRRHRPITLRISSETPEVKENQSNVAIGFRCLVNLYRHFDEKFLSQWNGDHTTCSIDSLVHLEKTIQNAVPADMDLPDVLMADLRVSQQWLRIMIWQLSITAGFLSTSPVHECMDFRYPIVIARDLCLATWKLSKRSMQTHGIGLIEKIFEVACTLIDVMACYSEASLRASSFRLGPKDYLKHLSTLINELPGGRARFLALLLTKLGQTLPSMLDSITAHLSLNSDLSGQSVNTRALLSIQEPDSYSSPKPTTPGIDSENPSDDWASGLFNYSEMSRIGNKTPEIDEAFLQYSKYFP